MAIPSVQKGRDMAQAAYKVTNVTGSITQFLGMSLGEFFSTMLGNNQLKETLFKWGNYIFKGSFTLSVLDWAVYLFEYMLSSNKAGNTYGLLRRTAQMGVTFMGGFLLAFFGMQAVVLTMIGVSAFDALVSFFDLVRLAHRYFFVPDLPPSEKAATLSGIRQRGIQVIVHLGTGVVLAFTLVFKVAAVFSFVASIITTVAGAVGLTHFIKAKCNEWFGDNIEMKNKLSEKNQNLHENTQKKRPSNENGITTYLLKYSKIEERFADTDRWRRYNEYKTGKYWINKSILQKDIIKYLNKNKGLNIAENSNISIEKIQESFSEWKINITIEGPQESRKVIDGYNFRPSLGSMSELEFLVEMYTLAESKKLFEKEIMQEQNIVSSDDGIPPADYGSTPPSPVLSVLGNNSPPRGEGYTTLTDSIPNNYALGCYYTAVLPAKPTFLEKEDKKEYMQLGRTLTRRTFDILSTLKPSPSEYGTRFIFGHSQNVYISNNYLGTFLISLVYLCQDPHNQEKSIEYLLNEAKSHQLTEEEVKSLQLNAADIRLLEALFPIKITDPTIIKRDNYEITVETLPSTISQKEKNLRQRIQQIREEKRTLRREFKEKLNSLLTGKDSGLTITLKDGKITFEHNRNTNATNAINKKWNEILTPEKALVEDIWKMMCSFDLLGDIETIFLPAEQTVIRTLIADINDYLKLRIMTLNSGNNPLMMEVLSSYKSYNATDGASYPGAFFDGQNASTNVIFNQSSSPPGL